MNDVKIEKKEKIPQNLKNDKKKVRTINEENSKDKFTAKMKEFIHPAHVSTNMYELESASADLAALPSYHYKFKKDYMATHIIRPGDTEELSKVIKACRKLKLPVTIRSAGTSCFSSATPTRGGVIIDMRRLNKVFDVDFEKKTVRCGAGISWLNLIEALSDYGLGPKSYPTSFKTSCVGGFIATPGNAGIGVAKNGDMNDLILALVFVKPDGEIIEITKGKEGKIKIDDIVGSYGIYGAIAEVELSVTTLKRSLDIVGHGFNKYEDALDYYKALNNDLTHPPFFSSVSERNFEKYSHVEYPEHEWLVWAVLYDDLEDTTDNKAKADLIAEKSNGYQIKEEYLKEKWRDVNDAEVAIGRTANNLVFQEYWIADKRLNTFMENYIKARDKVKFRTAFYLISGKSGYNRVKIFGLTDIKRPTEFFAVKAFLHERAVETFTSGDRLYTIGVVNTFYLHKFSKDVVAKKKILKDILDPDDLCNSMRYVNPKMKFWRVNLLFKTAKLLNKIF